MNASTDVLVSIAVLEAPFAMPYFQRFAVTTDELLEEPLRLIFLEQISS
ncbi:MULTISPECIES: hypothetical protein [Pseudomonas]|nr:MULTISPECIES: hypothetical protein [Pseudomonas]QXE10316.1 hypothetical protein GTQ41_15000 [Pseudomonas sp. AN-B15]